MEKREEKMNILAIDDDEDFLRFLALRVISWGHTIKTTASPSEFLKELGDKRYDVALVDFFIPAVRDAGILLSEIFAPYANGTRVYIMTDAYKPLVEKATAFSTVKIRGIIEKTGISEVLNGVLCGT